MSVIRVFCIFPADTETRTPGQKARKFTVSEKKIPLKDWIEVGVFGPPKKVSNEVNHYTCGNTYLKIWWN